MNISVVLPTFNRAHIIATTIESVLSQTAPPHEVIVVDDGSSDDTGAVCRPFPNVKYIRQPNGGVSRARNVGARAATGDWLAFIDSDDVWLPDKLMVQRTILLETEVKWCLCNCRFIDEDGRDMPGGEGFERGFPVFASVGNSADEWFGKHLDRAQVRCGDELITVYQGDCYGMLFHGNVAQPSGAIMSKRFFEEVGGFNEEYRVAEDTEFFHRAAAREEAVIIMSQLYKWRLGHPSLESDENTVESIQNSIRSLDRACICRSSMSEVDRDAYLVGRQKLWRRLAYYKLSRFDDGVRASLKGDSKGGSGLTMMSAALFLASFLPKWILRTLHAIKRRTRP